MKHIAFIFIALTIANVAQAETQSTGFPKPAVPVGSKPAEPNPEEPIVGGGVRAVPARADDASSFKATRVNFTVLGGTNFIKENKINSTWSMQPVRSPFGQIGAGYTFFADKKVNLIVGGQLTYVRGYYEVSSSIATSSITSDRMWFGPSVACGWNPWGADKPVSFITGLIGGVTVYKKKELQSPGFSVELQDKDSDAGMLGVTLLAAVRPVRPLKLMGGFVGGTGFGALVFGGSLGF